MMDSMDNMEMKAFKKIENLKSKTIKEIVDLKGKLHTKRKKLIELKQGDAVKNEMKKILEQQKKREERALQRE